MEFSCPLGLALLVQTNFVVAVRLEDQRCFDRSEKIHHLL
jgi:hypothetical protein